jgi:two-component system response regulator YesN
MMTIFKKRSIKYPWLLSYITLLIIPILISIVVYFVSSKVLEGEIGKANNSLLKQVQYEIDSRLKDIEKSAFGISINPSVKESLLFSITT